MYAYMYACMHVCIYVCTCKYVCMHACIDLMKALRHILTSRSFRFSAFPMRSSTVGGTENMKRKIIDPRTSGKLVSSANLGFSKLIVVPKFKTFGLVSTKSNDYSRAFTNCQA